jgi:hypothetical protein
MSEQVLENMELTTWLYTKKKVHHSILAPNRHPAFETLNAIFPMYLVQQLIKFHLWLLNWLSSGETTFSSGHASSPIKSNK